MCPSISDDATPVQVSAGVVEGAGVVAGAGVEEGTGVVVVVVTRGKVVWGLTSTGQLVVR